MIDYKSQFEKPNDSNLEKIILGTLLLESSAIYKVMQVLNENCFYQEINKHIYCAIIELHRDKVPIDIITVMKRLTLMGKLNDVGGPAYLAELTNRIGSSANLEYHANILFGYAIRRELIFSCEKISRTAYDLTSDVYETLEKARTTLFAKTTVSGNRTKSAKEHAAEIVRRSIEMQNQYLEVRGIPTGFQDLDIMTSGLQGGRFYVIGGRPSMGKTTFVINLVKNAVKKFGKKGLFISGEMSGEEITTIVIASDSATPMDDISKNAITKDNWSRILKTFDSDFDNLFIDDTPRPSLSHVWAEAIRLKEKEGIGFIAIDYLQLMTVNNRNMSPKEKVSLISGELKALSRHLDIPVIALSQLSRSCENRVDKRPIMSDLKETGDIEQDADFVAFLYRPEYYNTHFDGAGNSLEGIVEFIIRKHRHGKLGTILMKMKKEIGCFYSFDKNSLMEIPLDNYDMSITELKSLETIASKYENENSQDGQYDDIPF